MKMLIRIIAMGMLTFLMLSLTKCTPDNDRVAASKDNDQIEIDFERERGEIRRDLKKLGNDLDNRIDQITVKLNNAAGESRDRLEDAHRQLSDERSRIEEIAEEVEVASTETWNEVRVEAQNTSKEVKAAFTEVGNEISDFFNNKEDN